MSLLSLSPLLSSLFISYANRVAALESASAIPSPESEEWKTLQTTVATLREENERLESETRETAGKLEAAEASQEAFRSQVLSLKEVNTTQQGDINSLRAELSEAEDKYSRLMVDLKAEKANLQVQVMDLEAQRGELKETVVEQQIKISKFERRMSDHVPTPTYSLPPLLPPGAILDPSNSESNSPILYVPPPQAQVVPCPPLAPIPVPNPYGKNEPTVILPPSDRHRERGPVGKGPRRPPSLCVVKVPVPGPQH